MPNRFGLSLGDTMHLESTRPKPVICHQGTGPYYYRSQKTDIAVEDNEATIRNRFIEATMTILGKVMVFKSKAEIYLKECERKRMGILVSQLSAIEVEAREFKPIPEEDS